MLDSYPARAQQSDDGERQKPEGHLEVKEMILRQRPVEQFKNELVAKSRQSRVVTRPFITQECVLPVDFDPLKTGADLLEARMNQCSAFDRYMRVLAAPDVQQLPFDLARTFERVILHSLAEPVPVDIGRVEAGGGEHVGIHCGAEGEMSANADPHDAQPPRAIWIRL